MTEIPLSLDGGGRLASAGQEAATSASSILARRVLKHASFLDLDALVRAVDGFVAHWNAHEAHPFRWVFRGRFERRAA